MAPGGVGGVTATFDAYATDRTDARFTDWLRARSEPDWTDAVEHRFVHELADGTVDDAVFRRYLVQDYAFVWTLTGVFGYAVGQAPTMDAKASLTGFLGTLTDEENDYFERSFDALGVSPDERTDPVPADATEAFEDLLTRAALEGEYEETLAVLVPAEWIYPDMGNSGLRSPRGVLSARVDRASRHVRIRGVRRVAAKRTRRVRTEARRAPTASRPETLLPNRGLSKSRSSRWPTLDILPALNQGRGFSLASSVTAVASRPPPIPALWSALTSRARRVLAIQWDVHVCHPIVFVVNETKLGLNTPNTASPPSRRTGAAGSSGARRTPSRW